ncbi:response regulator receiver protein [Methylorubrum populi]|uniref:Response regulator receiver protein n=1 Tax=Methylorubrum populi TaxID=223967 RepID=A0A160PB37_9HYPH|nr:response regulator [Methylorubrum populi]BAU89999.1 response regulator receiver protein [Methylorubrum populi]
MLDSVRISLKVLNAAQLALIAAAALLLAWIGAAIVGAGPAADGAQRTALTGARAFAEAVNAELHGSVAQARTLALLLRPGDPALGEADRATLLRDWLTLNPRYGDAALIGADGSVRAAADSRRTGSSVARQPWFARARNAEIVIATNGGDETAPFDVILSLGMPGRSDRIQLRAGPAFLEIGPRLRQALDLPDSIVFTVRGADGRVLAGSASAPWGEHRTASVPVQGGRELGSPGWVVTAFAPAAAAAGTLPDGRVLALALAVVGAAAALGYALGGRASQPLQRLAADEAGPDEAASSPVREIAALSEAVTGRSRSREAALALAGTGLDRIKGRLQTFEAMSGWTCWEIDPETRRVVWSDADSTGTAAASDHAADLSDLAAWFEPEDRPLLDLTLDAARRADGPHDVVLRARAEGGAPIPEAERRVLVRFLREAGDGRRIHALSRAIEDGVSETPSGLNERRRNAVLRRVTDGIVHDFNDVLTIVTANLGTLRRRHGLAPEPARLVDAALAGAGRGAALTRRMLSLVRGEEGGIAECDVGTSVEAALAFMQANVLRDVPVINRVPGDLPKVLCAERILELVLLNLAFHFRDHGLRGFAVGAAAEHGGEAEAGFGLPPGPCVRLLIASGQHEPGRQAPSPLRPGSLETVARLLAEIEAGWHLVSDGTGEDAFVAEIWLRATGRGAEEPPLWQPALRVLLVESDSLVRASVAEALADLGHEVVQAASGEHALALLCESAAYDAMVADQSMPVMTGLQLAATVVERYPDIRIILASPHGHLPAAARQFLQLEKPFRPDDLAAVLSATAPQMRAA